MSRDGHEQGETNRHEEAPRARKRRWGCWIGGGLLVALLLTVAGGILSAHAYACWMECNNNGRQVGINFTNHHDLYKAYPISSTTDADGRPHRSWRMGMLRQFFYDRQFDEWFTRPEEPWDSEFHLAIGEGDYYSCPSESKDDRTRSVRGHDLGLGCFVMVTGPDMLADVDREFAMKDVADGLSNTLIVAEVTGDDRPAWIEPRDLPQSALENGVNAKDAPSIGSQHWGGATAVYCDGHATFLSNEIDPAVLKQLFNPRDGAPKADEF